MSDKKYYYQLSRLELPAGRSAETFAPVAEGGSPKSWFFGIRDGDRLSLCIDGEIRRDGIQEFDELFAGARTVHISLVECPGGDLDVALLLCRKFLQKLDRSAITCYVRGRCASSAIFVVCNCGFVTAAADASFLIHSPHTVLSSDDPYCDKPIGLALASLDISFVCARTELSRRLEDPARFLDGFDHEIGDMEIAKELGLIDRREYL